MTPDPSKAFDMLAAFASVGVQAFDVTLIDLTGEKKGYRPNRSLDALRQIMPSFLQETTRRQESVIIRPRKTARAELVQLDDLNHDAAERVAPFAFLVFTTSPGNFQAWIAVEDPPAADFALRLKRGSGADAFASGATRIAGSVNFKKKYAPTFPVVTITHTNAGNVTTAAALEQAGVVARAEERPPSPPASVPPEFHPPGRRPAGSGRTTNGVFRERRSTVKEPSATGAGRISCGVSGPSKEGGASKRPPPGWPRSARRRRSVSGSRTKATRS